VKPLVAKISIGSKDIGTLEMGNGRRLKNGRIQYEVVYKADDKEWTSKVTHSRADGALVLTQKACSAIAKQIRKFYSIPKDKIRYMSGPADCPTLWDEEDMSGKKTEAMPGAWVGVKASDIPERFNEEMHEALGVGTCGILEGESFIYLYDIERFFDKAIAGIKPVFD